MGSRVSKFLGHSSFDLIDGFDGHVHIDHHNAIGEGIEYDLGLPFPFLQVFLVCPLQLGLFMLYLNKIPEQPRSHVIKKGDV